MAGAVRILVGVLLTAVTAQAAPVFTKVADASTAGTGWTPATHFWAPQLDAGVTAFIAFDPEAGVQGVYSGTGGGVTTVADLTTLAPGTSDTFTTFYGVSLSQSNVAFVAQDSSGPGPSVYTTLSGSLSRLADATTPNPNGVGLLAPEGQLAIDGGNVAFVASDDSNLRGIFTTVGGVLQTSADHAALGPGHELWINANTLALDGTQVAFAAWDLAAGDTVFVAEGNVARVVADDTMVIPGGSETFAHFGDFLSFDDGNIAFVGQIREPRRRALRGNRRHADADLRDGGRPDGGGGLPRGLDRRRPHRLPRERWRRRSLRVAQRRARRLIATGDLLDGKLVNRLLFGARGLHGDQLAFAVYFDDDTEAVYIETIPEPGHRAAARHGARCARRGRRRAAR